MNERSDYYDYDRCGGEHAFHILPPLVKPDGKPFTGNAYVMGVFSNIALVSFSEWVLMYTPDGRFLRVEGGLSSHKSARIRHIRLFLDNLGRHDADAFPSVEEWWESLPDYGA